MLDTQPTTPLRAGKSGVTAALATLKASLAKGEGSWKDQR